MPGRRYFAVVDITYLGGVLPAEAYDALTSAVRDRVVGQVSCAVSHQDYDVITLRAELEASNPVEAITLVCAALDDALLATGLFEEFDVSGKELGAGPAGRMGP